MTETVAGICGNCNGLVIAATAHRGKLLTPARCAQCGAEPKNQAGARLDMGPAPITPIARLMAEVTRR